MTEISIKEMIVKVNSLPFYDKLVEASVNVTDFSGSALLTQVHILLYRRKKNAMWSAPKQETVFYVQLGTAFDF